MALLALVAPVAMVTLIALVALVALVALIALVTLLALVALVALTALVSLVALVAPVSLLEVLSQFFNPSKSIIQKFYCLAIASTELCELVSQETVVSRRLYGHVTSKVSLRDDPRLKRD